MKHADDDGTVRIRKWGNSLGIVLPKEMVKMKKLKAGERVGITLFKEADLSDIFGSYPKLTGRKIDAQKMKDEARKGWK